MKIAIFGSCVSRDMAEYITDVEISTYVARQSVISHKSPHGIDKVDLSKLNSSFQRRMVEGDLDGNGIRRICNQAAELDLILVDLVDERRGYWLFPDGTTITNSIEIESSGATAQAESMGARLVKFGSDEHFITWKQGFESLVAALQSSNTWERAVFVDMEWAIALEGARHPINFKFAKIGRIVRRNQRRLKRLVSESTNNRLSKLDPVEIFKTEPTEAESFADRAHEANIEYKRYRMVAQNMLAHTVTRESWQSRINRNHKWGPQPFHFRDEDYDSAATSIMQYWRQLTHETG